MGPKYDPRTRLPRHAPVIRGEMAGKKLYRYPTGLGDLEIRADIKLPTGKAYPPHLKHQRMWNWGRGGWHVECLVCRRYTGRARDRAKLAVFLMEHRNCGAKK